MARNIHAHVEIHSEILSKNNQIKSEGQLQVLYYSITNELIQTVKILPFQMENYNKARNDKES